MQKQSQKQLLQKQQNTHKNITKQQIKIQSQIGKGTFGKVYRAQLKQNDQVIALKHVFQNKRFKNRQLQILKEVNHPSIIQLFDYFYEETKEGTYLNLVMQYLPLTLSKVLKSKMINSQFISNQNVKKYAFWLLSGLEYLSDKNIGHRDIKPSNILLGNNGEAKICDFGSAKILIEGQKNLAYICSRFYRAPQLIFGAIQYNSSIDVWSLGCVLGQMLTNIPMFEGTSNMNQLIKIIKVLGSPTQSDMKGMKIQNQQNQKLNHVDPIGIQAKIKKINKEADKDMINLIEKMLVYDPNKRVTAKEALKLKIFQNFQTLLSKKNQIKNDSY